MAFFGLFKKKRKNFGAFDNTGLEKGNELGLPKEEPPGKELGMGEDLDITSKPLFKPQFQQSQSTRLGEANFDLIKKEMEIISAKIDALKASIETINNRLSNIEKQSQERRW